MYCISHGSVIRQGNTFLSPPPFFEIQSLKYTKRRCICDFQLIFDKRIHVCIYGILHILIMMISEISWYPIYQSSRYQSSSVICSKKEYQRKNILSMSHASIIYRRVVKCIIYLFMCKETMSVSPLSRTLTEYQNKKKTYKLQVFFISYIENSLSVL